MSPDRQEGTVHSPEVRKITRHATGVRRAQSGRPMVLDIVRRLPEEEVEQYVYGYASVVEGALLEIGIESPLDLGIHESIQHIVVPDRKMTRTSGIEGLNDGIAVVPRNADHASLSESQWNHYRDGYKIGLAFTRANLRKGTFAGLAPVGEIDQGNRQILEEEVRQWFSFHNVRQVDPGILIDMNPYARLGFAYSINSGSDGFLAYLEDLAHRLETNVATLPFKKQNLEAARNGFKFAEKFRWIADRRK